MADALDSKSSDRKVVWVQVPPSVLFQGVFRTISSRIEAIEQSHSLPVTAIVLFRHWRVRLAKLFGKPPLGLVDGKAVPLHRHLPAAAKGFKDLDQRQQHVAFGLGDVVLGRS